MKKCISLIFLIATFFNQSFGQKGIYINPFAVYQYSTISNFHDFRLGKNLLNYEKSLYPAFGVNFIFNTIDIFGVETGLKYSIEGQKYSGFIDYDANIDAEDSIYYTSEIKFKNIQIPFLLRFNSTLDEEIDNVYLTISAGIQLDYLVGAKMFVDPFPTVPTDQIEVKKLYHTFNLKFLTSGVFTFKLSDKLQINTGFQVSRSLTDIENKCFDFKTGDYPVEYYFPVSTKKIATPDATNCFSTRSKARILNYGFMLGVSYLLKNI